jgi:DNA invertase Pin-like site-specific DNA recombinase
VRQDLHGQDVGIAAGSAGLGTAAGVSAPGRHVSGHGTQPQTRSLLDLLETTKLLEQRQVNVVWLRENIDTTSATGRCFLAMMGAIHQMERELRAERAAAGRASAKARGRTGGRPRTDAAKLENARVLYENTDKTAAQACAIAGVGRRTFFAYLTERRRASG